MMPILIEHSGIPMRRNYDMTRYFLCGNLTIPPAQVGAHHQVQVDSAAYRHHGIVPHRVHVCNFKVKFKGTDGNYYKKY